MFCVGMYWASIRHPRHMHALSMSTYKDHMSRGFIFDVGGYESKNLGIGLGDYFSTYSGMFSVSSLNYFRFHNSYLAFMPEDK